MKRPLSERFWSKVEKSDGCWRWTGAKISSGYGLISRGTRSDGRALAHRVAWELEHAQPVPEGLVVIHSCDVRDCVRPSHLTIGTQADNLQDASTKGRAVRPGRPKGGAHWNARYTDAQVSEIRERLNAGDAWDDIAAAVGVPRSYVRSIKAGRRQPRGAAAA